MTEEEYSFTGISYMYYMNGVKKLFQSYSWLYNLFSDTIADSFKGSLQKQVLVIVLLCTVSKALPDYSRCAMRPLMLLTSKEMQHLSLCPVRAIELISVACVRVRMW